MEEQVEIIERAMFDFEQSGRASKTALSRFIIGRLKESEYELIKMKKVVLCDCGNEAVEEFNPACSLKCCL